MTDHPKLEAARRILAAACVDECTEPAFEGCECRRVARAILALTQWREIDEHRDPNDLLPCPFCGGVAERVDNGPTKTQIDQAVAWGQDFDDGGSFIRCTRCDASTALHFDRKENLISSWNDRVRSPSVINGRAYIELLALEKHFTKEVDQLEEMKARGDLTQDWGEASLITSRLALTEMRFAIARVNDDAPLPPPPADGETR